MPTLVISCRSCFTIVIFPDWWQQKEEEEKKEQFPNVFFQQLYGNPGFKSACRPLISLLCRASFVSSTISKQTHLPKLLVQRLGSIISQTFLNTECCESLVWPHRPYQSSIKETVEKKPKNFGAMVHFVSTKNKEKKKRYLDIS